MRKNLSVFALGCLGLLGVQAQIAGANEVTNTYLKNAGFDEEYNFKIVDTFNEIKGNQVLDVHGWTKEATADYTVAGTIELGTSLTVNGSEAIPREGYNASKGGVLALTTGWGSVLSYYQEVTLPAGKYTLETVYYNARTKTAGSSRLGWIPNEGEAVMSTVDSYAYGVWTIESVDFTLLEETAGKIQIGYRSSEGKSSTESAVLLYDYVKLYSHVIDKAQLAAQMETAEAVKNGENTNESAKAYLSALLASAQTVYDKADASMEELLRAIEALKAGVTLCADATLSDLQVGGKTIAGFAPEVTDYIYNMESETVPEVTASATGAAAGADVSIGKDMADGNVSVVRVTSGDGLSTKTYRITFRLNLLLGWDGDDTKTTPGAAGWSGFDGSNSPLAWSELDTPVGRNCFRTGICSGGTVRGLIGAPNNHYAYQIAADKLKEGEIYTFSCNYKWISDGDGEGRRWTFGFNTSPHGEEATMLESVTGTGGGVAQLTCSFVYAGQETVYLVWNGNAAAYAIDNLLLVPVGTAPSVTFDLNGASSPQPDKQYVMAGAKLEKPEDPVREGYVFLGWGYTLDGFDLLWDFDKDVVQENEDFTLTAQWGKSVKDQLKDKIAEVTAQQALGTEAGKAYLQTVIDAAQAVADNAEATEIDVENAIISLDDALEEYVDTRLADLLVAGLTVAGFADDVYEYDVQVAGVEVPEVTATALVECATVAVSEPVAGEGNVLIVTVTVTAGNGCTQAYVLNFLTQPSGINDVVAGEEPKTVEYYNLSGMQVAEPTANGVYIVKRTYVSGKTVSTKEYIRIY